MIIILFVFFHVATESNLLDTSTRLAHTFVRCATIHQRRTLRDTACAWLQHVDLADKIRAKAGSWHVRVSGESVVQINFKCVCKLQ